MVKGIVAALAVLFVSVSANAATFVVKTYEDGRTYIQMDGQTRAGDDRRLNSAIERAQEQTYEDEITTGFGETRTVTKTRTFSKDLYLTGPGGNAEAGVDVSKIVYQGGYNTFVEEECLSACSIIWMAAGEDNRTIVGDGMVGFHFAFITNPSVLNEIKDTSGWMGIQDFHAASTHYYTSILLFFGVKDPAWFVWKMASEATSTTFYEVTVDNIDETVGGNVM